jgi:hypothetical protein
LVIGWQAEFRALRILLTQSAAVARRRAARLKGILPRERSAKARPAFGRG